jgi:hypothetical protein
MNAFYHGMYTMHNTYEIMEVGPGPNDVYAVRPEAEWEGPLKSWHVDCCERHKVLRIGGFGKKDWGRLQNEVLGKENAKK